MRKGCHWDEERGMIQIDQSPEARPIPTPEEIKQWMATGVMPRGEDEEPCNCGECQTGTEDPRSQDE